MTRRTFAAAVASMLALLLPRGSYGLTTVDRWSALRMREQGARVLLDGDDITDDCVEFNDREGWARIFQRNAEGRHFLNDAKTGAASVRLRGRVEVTFHTSTRS
jgi:hypothetical protein